MSKYKVDSTSLTAIADAIRAKTGKSAAMEFPSEFVSEIGSISGGGGGVTWTEFTATSTASNTLDARNMLFPNASTATSMVCAATLKNKSVSNFPNNQLVSLVQFNGPNYGSQDIGNACRYRNGAYATANIARNYDAIIEVGDTFDLLEADYEIL